MAQNANNGTDHGTANSMFFLGGGLKNKGLLNATPGLSNLVDGDIPFSVDFRSVYSNLLENWLDTPAGSILPGNFPKIQIV